jgi:hypothetical protein
MIIIYTSHDAITRVLARCALGLRDHARTTGHQVKHLLEPPAGSSMVGIQAVLLTHDGPLFFFGHGKPPPSGLLSQEEVSAVDCSCGHLLSKRLVCAICCHSAVSLESLAKQQGSTVLGFSGELKTVGNKKQCLPPYDTYLVECVLAGLKELLAGRSAGSALQKMKDEFIRVYNEVNPGTMDMSMAAMASWCFKENAALVALVGDANRCL